MLKHLRNVARNIAHKFSVSAQHFAELSVKNGYIDVTMDFISGEITPSLFDIERNRILVGYCKTNFFDLLTNDERQMLRSVTLLAHFEEGEGSIFGDFTLTIILDNGRELSGSVRGSYRIYAEPIEKTDQEMPVFVAPTINDINESLNKVGFALNGNSLDEIATGECLDTFEITDQESIFDELVHYLHYNIYMIESINPNHYKGKKKKTVLEVIEICKPKFEKVLKALMEIKI